MIELVIVIVILGVLSAFALPRFADLSGDARQAKMEGVYGAMRSAENVVRMACEVDTACNPAEPPSGGGLSNAIMVGGENITLAYGYPRRTPAGIARAASIEDESTGGDYDLAQSTVSGVQRLRVRPDGDTAPNQCEVLYREPASAGESPQITIEISGC